MGWLAVGLVAQACYGLRFAIQWIASERAGRSLVPIHFWYLSVVGEVLLLAYAVHRRDPVIVVGQLAGLAIYLRNIQFIHRHRGRKDSRGWFAPWLLSSLAAGVAGSIGALDAASGTLRVDGFWTLIGFLGQFLFTSRFIVQWLFSERAGRSVTPVYFWRLSIVGSLVLLAYAIAVMDPVIIIGQAFGTIVYTRNLVLMRRQTTTWAESVAEQGHPVPHLRQRKAP